MKKERLIMVAGIVCLSLVIMAAVPFRAACGSPESFKWNLSTHGSPRALVAGVQWWAKEMEARTDGRFKVQIHWGASLSPAEEVLGGIGSGLFEAGVLGATWHPAKLPLSTVFELPFFAPKDTPEAARWMQKAYKHPAFLKEWEKQNAVPLFPICSPQWEVMSKKPIRSNKDWNGVRIRIPPDMGKVLETYGAVVIYMPTPEVPDAMEKGMVDAVAWPWAYSFGAFSIHEVAKYAIVGLRLGRGSMTCGASKKAWDAVPEDIKKVHEELMLEYPEVVTEAYAKADAKWLPIYKEKNEFIEFPPEDRAKLVAAAGKVWEEWVKKWEAKGLPAREILNYLKQAK